MTNLLSDLVTMRGHAISKNRAKYIGIIQMDTSLKLLQDISMTITAPIIIIKTNARHETCLKKFKLGKFCFLLKYINLYTCRTIESPIRAISTITGEYPNLRIM